MYETGVLIAFLLWLASVVRLLVALNSQLERNLRRIGMRQSWLNLAPKPDEPDAWPSSLGAKAVKLAVLIVPGLLGVLLSWVSVAWYVGSFLYFRAKDAGAPQAIREFRWKLRNQDMSKEQIAEAYAQAMGSNDAERQKLKETLLETQSL